MNVFNVPVPTDQEVVEWIQRSRIMVVADHPWKTALMRDRVLDNISVALSCAYNVDDLQVQLTRLLMLVREINRP